MGCKVGKGISPASAVSRQVVDATQKLQASLAEEHRLHMMYASTRFTPTLTESRCD